MYGSFSALLQNFPLCRKYGNQGETGSYLFGDPARFKNHKGTLKIITLGYVAISHKTGRRDKQSVNAPGLLVYNYIYG